MQTCDTAPLAVSFDEPSPATTWQPPRHEAYFTLSPDGLQWHPTQLAGWSRTHLFLLVEVLNQYAQQRSY